MDKKLLSNLLYKYVTRAKMSHVQYFLHLFSLWHTSREIVSLLQKYKKECGEVSYYTKLENIDIIHLLRVPPLKFW